MQLEASKHTNGDNNEDEEEERERRYIGGGGMSEEERQQQIQEMEEVKGQLEEFREMYYDEKTTTAQHLARANGLQEQLQVLSLLGLVG